MDEFEEKIKEIFLYIHEYGIRNIDFDLSLYKGWKELADSQQTQFLDKVRLGFRLGQDLILEEFLKIETGLSKKKNELKTLNRARLKAEIERCTDDISELEYKKVILRSFADFIAWQHFGNQYYIARRFHSGSKSRPGLASSNIESVKRVVKSLHEKDQSCFALISDLTSFIDIGDVLLIKGNRYDIIEIKEGEVNQKIIDLIHNFTPEKATEAFSNIKEPEKFAKQIDRTLKQMERAQKATDIIKNEEGPDPFSDKHVKILESKIPLRYYFDRVISLFDTLKTKNWVYNIIEGVVHIGIYKDNFAPIGREVLAQAVTEVTGQEYPVFSYISQLRIPLREPLFYKPFGETILFDLMFGRVRYYVAIDFNALLEMFNNMGLSARWIKAKPQFFVWQNQSIEVKTPSGPIVLGDTFLIRIAFDNLYPSSLVEMYML